MNSKIAVIHYQSVSPALALRLILFVAMLLLAIQGASAQTYYGSKWAADGLANTTINASHIQGDYRFRSTHTGTLAAIHTYWQNGSGYGSGTGGTYRIDLETDDGTPNHYASGKVLATTTELHPNSLFVTEAFSSPATITSGNLYHIVYTNIDANPAANFTSLDMIWVAGGKSAPTPSQPTVSDIDWAHLYNSGSVSNPSWHWRHGSNGDDGNYMPTLQLVYGDGTITGTGYMEVWIETSRKTVTGSNQARETLTVSGGDKIVNSFSIRIRKDSGNDPLTVTLKNGSGATIESGTIPSANLTATDSWATYTFSAPRTLANGGTYNIILSAPGSSSYSLFPIREGISYNFQAPTFFSDGHAQLSASSGSTWADWPDESGRASAQGDLQFYFVTGTQSAAAPMPPTELAVTKVN